MAMSDAQLCLHAEKRMARGEESYPGQTFRSPNKHDYKDEIVLLDINARR